MATRKMTVLFVFLLMMTAFLVLISAFLLVRVGARAADVSRSKVGPPYTKHIMMIGERIDSPFWQEVYEGARAVGSSRGAIIEMVGPATDADRKTTDEYVNYAIAARVDGILAYINDSPASKESLITAGQNGIPVIAMENDAFNSSRRSFVGVSSYELGKLLGNLIYEATGQSGNAVVLLDERGINASGNIMMSSIQESIQHYPLLHVSSISIDETRDVSYEDDVRRRILDDPDLKAIVCLNVEDTMRITQTLIEANRSAHISIIAFRESKEILEYVRKGIIYAVVVIDARQMGAKAAEAMLEFLETKHANDYLITDMHVVKRDTAGENPE
jgi:ribose transport system substrate-binding protein